MFIIIKYWKRWTKVPLHRNSIIVIIINMTSFDNERNSRGSLSIIINRRQIDPPCNGTILQLIGTQRSNINNLLNKSSKLLWIFVRFSFTHLLAALWAKTVSFGFSWILIYLTISGPLGIKKKGKSIQSAIDLSVQSNFTFDIIGMHLTPVSFIFLESMV